MTIATEQEHRRLKRSGSILAGALQLVANSVRSGISTKELDRIAEASIRESGAIPAFLGYKGFPATLCTSVNTRVVHGIPRDDEILAMGDIVGLDLGVNHEGIYTDMAVTVPVGHVASRAQGLITTAKEALDHAINILKAGMTTGDLGEEIQEYIESRGFSVVRDLVGHGVGLKLHEEPAIPNFGVRGKGVRFEAGMVIAIEPMVTAGDWHVKTLDDDWTIETLDGSLAAHFEHTVLITENGCELITTPNGKDSVA